MSTDLAAAPPERVFPSLRAASSAVVAYAVVPAVLPATVLSWLAATELRLEWVWSSDAVLGAAIRGRPRLNLLDSRGDLAAGLVVLERLKRDAFTGVIPTVAIVAGNAPADVAAAFAAGADEVLAEGMTSELESHARLTALLARSDRDVSVHPSTRLPGAPGIEAEYARRIASGQRFGVCYVDLDHFKEFNDRYSYRAGDGVICLLAKILHDVVNGLCGDQGFVGHIGGDDFICIVPVGGAAPVCEAIVELFDTLIPYQYSTPDRTTGYYFGKDRRGQLHRVPLMTVSIGVVTNGRRQFTHPAQISELATEMKSYAKTFSGSIYVVDRRRDASVEAAADAAAAADRAAMEGR